MKADFSGWATVANVKCADGKTIMPGAFKHQDQMRVPLVYQHGHNDPEMVLGHALLQELERDGQRGTYAFGFFNKTLKAQHVKEALEHGDLDSLSIYANQLVLNNNQVHHGQIREVSLVLAGANPGARIESVTIQHSDGHLEMVETDAIIHTGLKLERETELDDSEDEESDDVSHAEKEEDDETLGDVLETLTEKQRTAVNYVVAQILGDEAAEDEEEDGDNEDEVKQDGLQQDTDTDSNIDKEEDTDEMTHNVFEQTDDKTEQTTLSHGQIEEICANAVRHGTTLRNAVEAYAIKHEIQNIDTMFPEAKAISNTPEWLSRRVEWVGKLLGGVKKSPFARVKTLVADITEEQARAKGYITGSLKKEEFFSVQKRVTTPTTIYKKQKLDRDDMVDITDFNVVVWLKGEMRLMLDEELARAILVGDGRNPSSEDKINEGNIRPIASDNELYTTTVNVNVADADSTAEEIIDALILNRHKYRGSGRPLFFTTETWIAQFMLLKDGMNRRMYRTLDELASEIRVAEIVPVEVLEEYPDTIGVMVNPIDYTVGADAGGEVNMFDDFDIDYNQQKYLIETRVSGALTKPKSAVVVKAVAASVTLITPAAPAFDEVAGEITITNQTGVVYKRADNDNVVNAAGSPYSVASGESLTIYAEPDTGYAFNTSEDDTWTFTAE